MEPNPHPDCELPGICPFCANNTWCENSAERGKVSVKILRWFCPLLVIERARTRMPGMALIVFHPRRQCWRTQNVSPKYRRTRTNLCAAFSFAASAKRIS